MEIHAPSADAASELMADSHGRSWSNLYTDIADFNGQIEGYRLQRLAVISPDDRGNYRKRDDSAGVED